MYQSIENLLTKSAKLLAICAGLLLSVVALMTVISIIGRALIFAGLGPIPGDFELVEVGCAIAVFGFLPWSQLNRDHVSVDIFVDKFLPSLKPTTTLIGDFVIALAAKIMCWTLIQGLFDKKSFGEETYILAIPVWYGYAFASIGAVLFVLVSLFTIWQSLMNLSPHQQGSQQ